VYGPVQIERKLDFLQELNQKISGLSWPFILGGDFNLICFPWEKSSDDVNQGWMDAFNNFIMDNGLLELARIGNKFTWSNKQTAPVMSVLDRVLVCTDWDTHFKDASCESLTRIGSNHSPLIVNTADSRFVHHKNFRFEQHWLEQRGFKELVRSKWPVRDYRGVQDFWRDLKASTRKFYKGWGANFQSQLKREKQTLLDIIKSIDEEAEIRVLDAEQWQIRYDLEAELENMFRLEELQLKRHGGIKWTLKGDSNNKFFHGVANGRRRKSSIFCLEEEGVEIRDQKEIRVHIDSFYKDLFSKETEGEVNLGENFLADEFRLTEEEGEKSDKTLHIKRNRGCLERDGYQCRTRSRWDAGGLL
jgi:hypothetical protein